MTNLGHLEIYNKPNKSEIFHGLAKKLIEDISFFRLEQNLDQEHLNIILFSILNLINPCGNHKDFLDPIEGKMDLMEPIYDNLLVLMGWEVFMRLEKENQKELNSGALKVEDVNLLHLIIYFSEIFCDSEKCLKYFKTLSVRNAKLFQNIKSQIVESISSVRVLTHTTNKYIGNLLNDLTTLSKDLTNEELVSSKQFNVSRYISHIPTLFVIDYNEHFTGPEIQGAFTSSLIEQKSTVEFGLSISKQFELIDSKKNFDINNLHTAMISANRDSTLLIPIGKANITWMSAMIDHIIFNLETKTKEEWDSRLRFTSQIVKLGLENIQKDRLELRLVFSELSEYDTAILNTYGVEIGEVLNKFESGENLVYQLKSNIYYVFTGDRMLQTDRLENGEFIVIKSCNALEDVHYFFESSSYHSLLNILAKISLDRAVTDNRVPEEGDLELICSFIKVRLHNLISNAYQFNESNSSKLQYFKQIFLGLNIKVLLDENCKEKTKFLIDYLQRPEILSLDQSKISSVISSMCVHFKKHKDIPRIPITKETLAVGQMGYQKDIYIKKAVECLDSMSVVELSNYLDLIFSDQNYSAHLVNALAETQKQVLYDKINDLKSISTYTQFAESKALLKQLNHDEFINYITNHENATSLFEWCRTIANSYNDFIEQSTVDEYERLKPQSFQFIKEIIKMLKRFSPISDSMCDELLKQINASYLTSVDKFNIPQVYLNRTNMKIALGTNTITSLISRKEETQKFLKEILFVWLFYRSERSEYKELFSRIFGIIDEEILDNLFIRLVPHALHHKLLHKILDSSITDYRGIDKKTICLFASNLSKIQPSTNNTVRNRYLINLIRVCGLDFFMSYIHRFLSHEYHSAIDVLIKEHFNIDEVIFLADEIIRIYFRNLSDLDNPMIAFSI